MSASCGHSHRKRRRRATPSAVDSPSNGSPMHETTPRRTNWVVPLYILWSAWLLRLDVTYGQETIPPQPGRTSNPALPPLTTPTQPSPVSSQPTVFSAPPSSPPTMLPTVSARPTVSAQPSNVPSLSHRPSAAPSIPPTKLSSTAPSEPPTLLPSNPPSFFPTVSPAPSQTPSNPPSQAPTTSPQPSATPSISLQPTVSSKPSTAPTISVPPTNEPSTTPSDIPSNMPSLSPSDAPSTFPTIPLSTFTQSFMSLIIVGIDQNLTVREIATWTTLTSEHVRQFWLGVRRSPVFVGEVTTRFVGQEPVDGGAIPRARQRRLQTLSPTVAPASGAMRIRYQQDIRYGIIVDFVDSLFDPLEETLFTAPFTFGQAEYNAALDTLRNSTDPLFVSDVMVGQPPTQPPSMRDNQGRTVIISTVVAVLLVVGAASAFIVYKIRKEDEQDTVGQFPSDDAGDEMFFHHTERLDSPDSYVETRPDADISQLTYPMHGTTRNTSSGSNASVLTFGEDSGPSGSGDGMPDTPTDAAPAAASSAPHTLGGPFVKPASIARTASSEYAMAASLASQQGAPLKVIEDPDAMLPSNDGGTAVNQWPTETDDPDYPPHAFAGFQMQIQDLDDL